MSGGNVEFTDPGMAAKVSMVDKQFRFVKISDPREVDICGAGEAIYGILQNNPAITLQCEIALLGISNLIIGAGGVSAGGLIKSGVNGEGIASAADREQVGAIAREDAIEGDICSVFIVNFQTSHA